MKVIRLFCVVLSLICIFFIQKIYAETTPVVEYKVKAGYLFNFTKFITWSDDSLPTFNICIIGSDPFGELLNPIEQRTAFNKPIKLFRLVTLNTEQHCHIAYISAGNTRAINSNIKNMLIVGDNPAFIMQGGMIAFINQENRIKLQINLKLAQQSGLKISAKLLEVAELVGGDND